jgi:hypothetical protein
MESWLLRQVTKLRNLARLINNNRLDNHKNMFRRIYDVTELQGS